MLVEGVSGHEGAAIPRSKSGGRKRGRGVPSKQYVTISYRA